MSAIEGLPDPVFVFEAVRDPGGTVVELTYTFLNDAGARLYGMSADEVVGHGQIELFPSVKDVGIWEAYLGVIESGSPTSFEVPYFNENSVEGSFRLTATKLGDGLLVLAADITDQVKAEKAREAGKAATLRATLDSLMDPYVLYEAIRNESGEVIDFTFVDANPAACEYNKRSREHLIGSTLAQEYPDFINDPRREAYAAVLATGEPLALDDTTWAQPRLFAGQVRHYDLRAAQVSESLLSVTWRDITDRAEAEEALEAERTILRATLDSLLDPAVRFDPVRDKSGAIIDFVFVDANPAACAYNHSTREELIGTRLLDIFPGMAATGLIDTYAHVLETGEPLALDDYAYPLALTGGQEHYLDIRAVRVDGGIAYTWREVTDRRQAKRDLEARLQELEQFQRLTVGRELKMIELKKEIEYLKKHGSAGSSDPDD